MHNKRIATGVHISLACILIGWSVAVSADMPSRFNRADDYPPMIKMALRHYAMQVKQYSEGEDEGEIEGEIEGEGEGEDEGEGEGENEIEGEGEGEGEDEIEGEGEGEGEIINEGEEVPPPLANNVSWREYASIGGIIALALGILWLAEEPPSPCMVATAAYGTPLSGKLTILRIFRDRVLLNTAAGTAVVDVYYRVGTRAAAFVATHKWAARLVRILLLPVLLVATLALLAPEAFIAAGYAIVFLGVLIVLYWYVRLRGWRLFPLQKTNGPFLYNP